MLAPMVPVLPRRRPSGPTDVETLRCAVRVRDGAGFLFLSNYQRYVENRDIGPVQVELALEGETLVLPEEPFVLRRNITAIWPFNLRMGRLLLKVAAAQPFCRLLTEDGPCYVFFATPGVAPEYVFDAATLPDPALAVEIWGLSLDRNSPVGNRTLFVTAGGEVYRSTDDGYTWSLVFSGGRARITAVDRFDGNLVYAGGDGGFWHSTDGGETWDQVGLPEMRGVYDIEVDPSNPGRVYVACYGNGLGVYRSRDGGESWENLWTNTTTPTTFSPISSSRMIFRDNGLRLLGEKV